ncbi:DUF418 domain-containing protein [Qipengyuania sp. 1NDH17]|uniref:DUF418 domain-containing protein n=2 Tax=Qipengyuania polymorpha TaxID=2867234 RepID=A0ABS7J1A3_9SPHN|nr:DUF418 domain-containing protein [Qipengyuania polymorpha]
MGILAANIMAMGQPFTAYAFPEAFTVPHSEAEDWMWVWQLVLVDGKMRGLFTLLFGAGLYLFLEKAWAKGATTGLQAKRLLWLGLFGLVHFYFIWRGDILFFYAVSGLVALLFIGLSARKQLVLGILGYIAGGILYGALFGFMQNVADGPAADNVALESVQAEFVKAADADLADGRAESEIRQEGSYLDYVAHNFEAHAFDPLASLMMFAFETLPLMLIGMALYRMGFFSGGFSNRKMRLWGLIGLVAGGALTLWIALSAKAGGFTYYGALAAFMGWSHFPRIFMTLGIAALLVSFAPAAGGWLSERVSAAGRAAFTNYLGTSVVMLLVFGNWGLDLFGALGRSELYLVTIAAWLVMLAWSKPWLERFRYGPLEWLWRCLTYGRRFPLKR